MRDYRTLVEALRPTGLRCHIAAGSLRSAHNPWLSRLDVELPDSITLSSLPAPDLRELYARSRFTVVPLLPSHTDNGITAILESFAMAKPVVVTRTPGQVGVVQHGVNGLLVPPGSPEALRAAVERLWNDPDECARMGRNARRWVEEHHTPQQWLAAFQDLPARTSRPSGRALS
jgi:glycosyltransferase involved in cell wall biosynthesis